MAQNMRPGQDVLDTTAPLILFSQDTHISPRPEDVRSYCPEKYLEYFDDFVRTVRRPDEVQEDTPLFESPDFQAFHDRQVLNRRTAGGYDMAERIRDLDRDGVVAAAIFHGAGEPFPLATQTFFFGGFLSDSEPSEFQMELTAVGIHLYNQWLADVTSIEPERHIACAHVPNWDPEATLQEIIWAREHGIRSVNWPAPRMGMTEYDNPIWEPVWSACEELGVILSTHAGAVVPGMFTENPLPLPHGGALIQLESVGWPARRGLHRMIFSGVFERHPDLKLVLTELAGPWWPTAMREMNAAYEANYTSVKGFLPKPPSEYCRENVFIGSSFTAPFEAEDAVEQGYADNLLWGSDYPHPEGSWKYPEADDEEATTRLHLRHTFAGIPTAATAQMVSENAIRLYGLDREKLTKVAQRIGAPTLDELATPIDGIPETYRYSTNPGTGSAFHKPNPAALWPTDLVRS